jgi:HEAT repeat protein
LFVEVRHGQVTLRADNHSLKKVLEALAHESGVQINAQLIMDRPLSTELVRVPLDRALQAILEFEDSFFAFASRGQAAALQAVWVVPAGTGGKWPPQTSACARELSALEQQLASAHASQRAEAIETLIDLQGPEAAQAVVQSLADQDDDVRYRALQKAYVAGVVLPPEVLAELVQHDSFALVRMMAVEAIGHHPAIDVHDKQAFARYAIDDESPAVQTRASELLSHLEAAPLMREQEEELYGEAHREQLEEFRDEDNSGRAE